MNNQIRLLAEQAGFHYIKDEGIGWAGNYNASLPKFAELIVRECANIADIAEPFLASDLIKQQFGVKE